MKSQKSGKTVLIVEDNDLNLKLFTDLIEAHGHCVIHTQDGEEAENMVREENPDLIIMDIQLPHICGIDIIKSIKSKKELMHIPILAVTAFAMHNDEERIIAAGCEDYLAKPISIEPFIKTISKYLE